MFCKLTGEATESVVFFGNLCYNLTKEGDDMRIEIRGDKLKVTDSIKSQIEEKLGKLDQYFNQPEEIKAYVVVRVKNNEQIIEVTIPTPKFTLRSETSHEDLYAAINLSVDKLERQIRKNKTKLKKKFKDALRYEMMEDIEEQEPEEESLISKRKTIDLKPMDEEEAILQMELLGHDFFIFKNVDTENISVVYKRKDGKKYSRK